MLVTDHIPSINCFRDSRGKGPAKVVSSTCMHSYSVPSCLSLALYEFACREKGRPSMISLCGLDLFWVQSKGQVLRLGPAQHRGWTDLSTIG
ncbi:hypothetical protein CsSME_00016749 [Camellia sinensis var. sinensis]